MTSLWWDFWAIWVMMIAAALWPVGLGARSFGLGLFRWHAIQGNSTALWTPLYTHINIYLLYKAHTALWLRAKAQKPLWHDLRPSAAVHKTWPQKKMCNCNWLRSDPSQFLSYFVVWPPKICIAMQSMCCAPSPICTFRFSSGFVAAASRNWTCFATAVWALATG